MSTLVIVGLAIAGTGVAAYGQYQQGKQAQAQAQAQSAWNMYNAKVAQREADAEQKAADFASKQQKKRAKHELAKRFVGGRGVEFEGSPLLEAEDTAAEFAKEAQNIRIAGQRRVAAYKSQSILDISKASAAKSRAAGFGRAAVTGAGSTILSGASQAMYMKTQM